MSGRARFAPQSRYPERVVMRNRRNVILGLVIASCLTIACGSGVGPMATVDDGKQPTPIVRDNPGPGREPPPQTGEAPPAFGDNPGTHGGGGRCPPCDVKLSCVIGKDKLSVTLQTKNGQCMAVSSSSSTDVVTFDCNGRIVDNGTPVGTWSGSGNSYTITTTLDGQPTTLTCTKGQTSTATTNDAGHP